MVVILQYISTNLNCSQLAGRKQLGGHSFSKSELIALMLGEYDIDIYVMYIYIQSLHMYSSIFTNVYLYPFISLYPYSYLISLPISDLHIIHIYMNTHTCICIYIYLQIFCLQIQTSALEVHELPAVHGQVQSPGLDEGGRPDDWIVDSWTRRGFWMGRG